MSIEDFPILFCEFDVIDDFIPETNPLNLDSVWEEAYCEKKDWSRQATIKIFSDEKKFEEYQKTLNKSDSKNGV